MLRVFARSVYETLFTNSLLTVLGPIVVTKWSSETGDLSGLHVKPQMASSTGLFDTYTPSLIPLH